jgi:hypothetical protein
MFHVNRKLHLERGRVGAIGGVCAFLEHHRKGEPIEYGQHLEAGPWMRVLRALVTATNQVRRAPAMTSPGVAVPSPVIADLEEAASANGGRRWR